MTDENVWLLDSSALIEAKRVLPVDSQWVVFKRLEEMVENGAAAMPRQVIREMSEIAHPDLPGAWAPGVRDRQRHPLDAEWEHVQRVMTEAGDVVDPNKTTEDADPYVLALALQLVLAGEAVVVVTEDCVDRNRIALTTACDRLGLSHGSVRDFFAALGVKMKKAKADEGVQP